MNNVNKTLYLQFITDIVLLPPEMINKLKDFERILKSLYSKFALLVKQIYSCMNIIRLQINRLKLKKQLKNKNVSFSLRIADILFFILFY